MGEREAREMTKNPAKKRPTTTAATLCVIFLATVILKMTTLGTRETRSHDAVERSASDGISRWRPKITMKMIFSNVVGGGGAWVKEFFCMFTLKILCYGPLYHPKIPYLRKVVFSDGV